MTSGQHGLLRLWGAPVTLAAVSVVGLFSALFGDGAWDALSWLALAAPLAITAACLMRRRS